MSSLLIRFQFTEFRANQFVETLKQRYGAGIDYVAEGTMLIDTHDSAEEVFELLAPMFTYDDKLFVAQVSAFKSLHSISRTGPAKAKDAFKAPESKVEDPSS